MDAIELDPQLMVDSFSEASTFFGLTFHLGKTEVLGPVVQSPIKLILG